ncbi:MAG: T9SS type A sorting domain-containing protein, partial [Bacteroidia bacterium]|nr:T9SS type A sorting domain-containing protein [Bacteroidia bacterium]
MKKFIFIMIVLFSSRTFSQNSFMTIQQPTCNVCNGIATANPPSFLTPPLQFQWTILAPAEYYRTDTGSTFQNLCYGLSFRLDITDANGDVWSDTDGYTIEQIDDIHSVVVVDESCSGCCDGFAYYYHPNDTSLTFIWSPNGETNDTINNLCSGTYSVCIFYPKGNDTCSYCTGYTVNHSVGIDENFAANIFTLYPNPALDQISIATQDINAIQKISVYDLTGRLVK